MVLLNLPQNRVNGANRIGLFRWKPQSPRGLGGFGFLGRQEHQGAQVLFRVKLNRFRRRWSQKMVTTASEYSSEGVTTTQGGLLELTLVAVRNNFWGLFHHRYTHEVVHVFSAGAVPGFEGSKRSTLQAAGEVARRLRNLLLNHKVRHTKKYYNNTKKFYRHQKRSLVPTNLWESEKEQIPQKTKLGLLRQNLLLGRSHKFGARPAVFGTLSERSRWLHYKGRKEYNQKKAMSLLMQDSHSVDQQHQKESISFMLWPHHLWWMGRLGRWSSLWDRPKEVITYPYPRVQIHRKYYPPVFKWIHPPQSEKFRPCKEVSYKRKFKPEWRWWKKLRKQGHHFKPEYNYDLPWKLNLVGWCRDPRWKHVWETLRPQGNLVLRVNSLRCHNGLRHKKLRRK